MVKVTDAGVKDAILTLRKGLKELLAKSKFSTDEERWVIVIGDAIRMVATGAEFGFDEVTMSTILRNVIEQVYRVRKSL